MDLAGSNRIEIFDETVSVFQITKEVMIEDDELAKDMTEVVVEGCD